MIVFWVRFKLFAFDLAGSVTSLHSQPGDSRALLQVPDVSPVHPRTRLNLTPPRIAPPTPSPSPRSLRRQVRDPTYSVSPSTHRLMECVVMSRCLCAAGGT